MHLYDPECKGILDTKNLYFLVNSVLLNLYWYIHQTILKKSITVSTKSQIKYIPLASQVQVELGVGAFSFWRVFYWTKNCVGKDDLSISVKDQFWLLKSTNTNRQS